MRTRKPIIKELLYLQIARGLENQIAREVLKPGDKLPSIRMICREHGVSMTTAQYAYYELERKSLIESRPQSGYYVSHSFKRKLEVPGASKPGNRQRKPAGDLEPGSLQLDMGDKNMLLLSRSVPAQELLPVAKLNKGMVQALRSLPGSGVLYEPVAGNEKLRRQVAKWSFNWKGSLSAEDVITSGGCIGAVSYCLLALTRPGDTIVVESPCFYGLLRLAQGLGLRILEVPTHPQTGVELDALKKLLTQHKVKCCLFVSNFSNPPGSLMPDAHKKEAVKLLERYHVPLIEDDLYGDIYFGDSRPSCCKSYDESGLVLLCGSVSKTLAPGYRAGWVAPGQFYEAVTKVKLQHSISSPSLAHEVIGNFLENGRYEAHLRKLRKTVHTNYLQYVRVISTHFPEGTKISRPQGGLSLWVELPSRVNTIDLYNTAMQSRISIAPGPLFTLQQQFYNCLRLSYGLVWTDKVEHALKQLGRMATDLAG